MQPNVLIVSLDTLRFDCVGAIGEHRFLGPLAREVASPALDALAGSGAVFTRAVSAAPFTTPSHASLFTGHWVPNHGAWHQYKTPISASAPTLAELLAARGYRTAQSAGRSDGEGVMFSSETNGLKRGFETSIFSGSVNRATKRWLKRSRGEPWFLFFHTFAAHWPYGLPPTVVEPLFERAWARDDWTDVRRLYVRNARQADRMVGELLEIVERLGELDRTIVVVLSDHGEGLNHAAPLHGPINGGREEVIRVPLVVRAPWRIAAGARVDTQVRTVDVLPTILDLLGDPLDANGSLAGASVLPLLDGREPDADRPAFFVGHLNDDTLTTPLLAGLRTDRWKFIVDDCTREKVDAFEARLARQSDVKLKADLRARILREMFEEGERIKLYDLDEDPLEERNVAAEHPELVAEFERTVARLVGAAGVASDDEGNDDALLDEQLRALGYLT